MSLADDVLHDVLEERGGGVTVWHVRCLEAYLRFSGRHVEYSQGKSEADVAAERLAHDMRCGTIDRMHLEAQWTDALHTAERSRGRRRVVSPVEKPTGASAPHLFGETDAAAKPAETPDE